VRDPLDARHGTTSALNRSVVLQYHPVFFCNKVPSLRRNGTAGPMPRRCPYASKPIMRLPRLSDNTTMRPAPVGSPRGAEPRSPHKRLFALIKTRNSHLRTTITTHHRDVNKGHPAKSDAAGFRKKVTVTRMESASSNNRSSREPTKGHRPFNRPANLPPALRLQPPCHITCGGSKSLADTPPSKLRFHAIAHTEQ